MSELVPTDDVVDGELPEEEFLVDDEPARTVIYRRGAPGTMSTSARLRRVGERYFEPLEVDDG